MCTGVSPVVFCSIYGAGAVRILLNYSRISLLVAVSPSDNEFDCRPQKSVPAGGGRFPGAISRNPTSGPEHSGLTNASTRATSFHQCSTAAVVFPPFCRAREFANQPTTNFKNFKSKVGLLSCLEPNHQ